MALGGERSGVVVVCACRSQRKLLSQRWMGRHEMQHLPSRFQRKPSSQGWTRRPKMKHLPFWYPDEAKIPLDVATLSEALAFRVSEEFVVTVTWKHQTKPKSHRTWRLEMRHWPRHEIKHWPFGFQRKLVTVMEYYEINVMQCNVMKCNVIHVCVVSYCTVL